MELKAEKEYTNMEEKIAFLTEYNARLPYEIRYRESGEHKYIQAWWYTADELAEVNKEKFKAEFFETSLGWIRRKVSMKDGSTKDFLGDLLLPIKAGLEMGQEVEIITYKTPDFTKEYTTDYIISLQEKKAATADFVKECLAQVVKDFGG